MLNLLTKISVDKQKSVAGGLLGVAALATPWGFLMLMGFVEKTEEKCTGHLWAKKCVETEIPLGDRLVWLLLAVGSLVVALACVLAALRLTTMQGHLKRYVAILTGVEAISIQRVAEITHSRPGKVRDEIQTMIDSGHDR